MLIESIRHISPKSIGKLIGLLRDKPSLRTIRNQLVSTYLEKLSRQAGMRQVNIDDIVEFKKYSFHLESLEWEEGHTTRLELLYILAIIKSRLNSGENFLEIGTFDGNTALNICHNLPEESKLYTIDLPDEVFSPAGELDYDAMLIESARRKNKKHLGCRNVEQIYADSTKFDFSSIKFNGAFIDGGHAFHIVKSDSEKIIESIQRPGFILWHDYGPTDDVGVLIHQLRKDFDVRIISGTHLCFLDLP
jgi:predicted O-methyltransferase YrrM